MKAVFGLLAFALGVICYAPYIFDIVRRRIKPRRAVWGMLMILTNIVYINQVRNGGGWSVWYFGVTALLVSVIFVLSLSRGKNDVDAADKVLLACAALLLGFWLITQDTRISTIGAAAIDACALLPSLLSAYRHPSKASYQQWLLAAAGGFCALLAIERMDYILYVYPLYILVMNCLVAGAKYYAERIGSSE